MGQSNLEEQVQSEIFFDQDEKLLCTAGTPQLERFLKTGKARKSFAVLSDQAVYCKGKCSVSRDRRSYTTQQTDFRIDLEEFQGLRYLQRKNQIFLTFGFFFLLLGPALLVLDKIIHFGEEIALNPTLDAVICLLLSGVFFLFYSIHTKTMLELIHTNGSIGLALYDLSEKEEHLFIRYLRAFLRSRDTTTT